MTTIEYNNCVNKLEDRVFGFIFKSTRDRELTKDIVQESLMRFWVNKDKVEIPKAKSWLFTTAYNHMINTLKKQERFVTGELYEHADEDIDNDLGRNEVIMTELKKLPMRDRRLIILRDMHGYSYDEIGTKMGLNKSQVKVYLFRVRKKLKERFKDLNR